MARFAETLLPLLHPDEAQAIQLAEAGLARFSTLFHAHWLAGMRMKLGLFTAEEDEARIEQLLTLMKNHQ